MIGWFSAFREHGAPTSYGDNRTPVMLDFDLFGIVCLFAIPSMAFLLILPGLRKRRTISSLVFLTTMAVGATLLAMSMVNNAFQDLLFNERFYISEVHIMQEELTRALRKGLPYPILKVVEYLSVDRAGFTWGRTYRMAGYYTAVLLWMAFFCWLISLSMLCLLPSQFADSLFCTGLLMLIAVCTYSLNLPDSMDVHYASGAAQNVALLFSEGEAYFASLIAGCMCIVLSLLLRFLSCSCKYELDTVFTARRYIPNRPTEYLPPPLHKSCQEFLRPKPVQVSP